MRPPRSKVGRLTNNLVYWLISSASVLSKYMPPVERLSCKLALLISHKGNFVVCVERTRDYSDIELSCSIVDFSELSYSCRGCVLLLIRQLGADMENKVENRQSTDSRTEAKKVENGGGFQEESESSEVKVHPVLRSVQYLEKHRIIRLFQVIWMRTIWWFLTVIFLASVFSARAKPVCRWLCRWLSVVLLKREKVSDYHV